MKQAVVVLFLLSSLYVSGVYSAFGLPVDIPGLSASMAAAIGSGIAPLVAVNASVNENLAQDTTGTLDLIQKVIGNASYPLDSLLNKLQEASKSVSNDANGIESELNRAGIDTYLAVGYAGSVVKPFITAGVPTAKSYAAQLSTKLSPSVYGTVMKTIADLIDAIIQDDPDNTSYGVTYKNFYLGVNNALAFGATSSAVVTMYVTPALVKPFMSSLTNVTTTVGKLADVLQQAVWQLFPPTTAVDPVIGAKLPNIVSLLVSFNSSADNARTSLKQTGKSLANDATSTFRSVTLNPWNWNDGNIANLTTFLANFTKLVHKNFSQSLDAGIDYAKANVNASVTSKINQAAQLFTKIYTNISDTSTKSSSMFKAQCIASFNAQLLTILPTLSRLSSCIQMEDGSFDAIKNYATNSIRKAKDDATKSLDHLKLCNEQSGACSKKIFASFENRYQNSVTSLTLIGDYTSSSLKTIADRVTDCTAAISAGIGSQAQTLQVDFNSCLAYGYYRR